MGDRGRTSINEDREVFNLPPIEDGDRHFIRGEYRPVDSYGETVEPVETYDGNTTVDKALSGGIMETREPVFGDGHKIVDNKPEGGDEGGSNSGEQEETPRHSNDGTHSVDWEKVNSDEYQAKIEKLSDDEKVCKAIKTRAVWALNNRDGTDTEELYAIDLSTGEEIGRITDQHVSHGVKRSKTFDRKLADADDEGRQILLIHNHPTGMPPSPADVNELLKCKNAIGITVGHDGSIYKYTRPQQRIDDRDWDIFMRHYHQFSEKTAQEKTMQELANNYGFTVEKL